MLKLVAVATAYICIIASGAFANRWYVNRCIRKEFNRDPWLGGMPLPEYLIKLYRATIRPD